MRGVCWKDLRLGSNRVKIARSSKKAEPIGRTLARTTQAVELQVQAAAEHQASLTAVTADAAVGLVAKVTVSRHCLLIKKQLSTAEAGYRD